VEPFIDSLLEPFKKTLILPKGIINKKAKKSLAASSLVYPSSLETLLFTSI